MQGRLTVRNYNPQEPRDAAAYERLKEGAVLAHLLSHPYYQAEKNLFFAEADGEIIGFMNILPELAIGRVVLDYSVGPSYRLEVIFGELLKYALKRSREAGSRVAHLSAPSVETATAEILSKLGFKQIHRFCEMRLNISDVTLEAAVHHDWTYRYYRDDDEETLSDIQNRCFADTWGYNPNTVEDTVWQMQVRNNCPEDVILATDNGRVVGYCWTESECGLDSTTGGKKGRVYMLGVDSRARGKGLGKQLLLAGLLHLKNKGRELIDITVDSQNNIAITLYLSLGFYLHDETVWYEKAVP